MIGYSIISLNDMLDTLGEDSTKDILSNFSCPLNADVDFFLRIHQLFLQSRAFQ